MSDRSNNFNEQHDRILALIEAVTKVNAQNSQAIAANSQAIAANSQAIAALEKGQEESKRQIDDLRYSIAELREGQAILMQFFVEQREELAEFKTYVKATLDRIDRTLSYLLSRDGGNPNLPR